MTPTGRRRETASPDRREQVSQHGAERVHALGDEPGK
jgi:hypothetical protein